MRFVIGDRVQMVYPAAPSGLTGTVTASVISDGLEMVSVAWDGDDEEGK